MVRLAEWKRLFDLARRRTQSPEAYRRFQAYQGQLVLAGLARKGVALTGQRVLDLGCGLGGYTLALQQHGAWVVSLDLAPTSLAALPAGARPVCADTLRLPFADASFDFVFCASLIEHVPRLLRLLQEIQRTLRIGGLCYLSFPPFYSLRGGHQFAPYHLLGERFATWAYRRTRARRLPNWQKDIVAEEGVYSSAYRGFGLHRVTIRATRKWLGQTHLKTVGLSTRFSPVNTASWPLIGEALTWHAEFLLRNEP